MQHGPFGQLDLWVNEPIMIPSVAPSGIPYCSIIHISYRIQVDIGNVYAHCKNTLFIMIFYIVHCRSWDHVVELESPANGSYYWSIPIIRPTTLSVAPQISNYPENVDNQHQPMRIGLEDRE